MRRPEIAAHLWEAAESARPIREYVAGQTLDDFRSDVGLRDRVERRFIRVGEALSQAAKLDPNLDEVLPELPRIVAFRNVLIHGYATINDEVVWQVANDQLDSMISQLDQRLAADGTHEGLESEQ
ncbi:MAG: DUF86 domain-containing protein [Ilumatobacter sp.]|uniref:HepT-like ribonuclease domain-containing protein n=1 Tax=Ilumatobacter sp. TaxID=1967498 RepID=UPI00391B06BB